MSRSQNKITGTLGINNDVTHIFASFGENDDDVYKTLHSLMIHEIQISEHTIFYILINEQLITWTVKDNCKNILRKKSLPETDLDQTNYEWFLSICDHEKHIGPNKLACQKLHPGIKHAFSTSYAHLAL